MTWSAMEGSAGGHADTLRPCSLQINNEVDLVGRITDISEGFPP
jgi:hypothetical protein